jgi:hypothetical protein
LLQTFDDATANGLPVSYWYIGGLSPG